MSGARVASLSGISIVVMAFNERESIVTVVDELRTAAEALAVPFEIMIVDDGSSDGTSELADELASRSPNIRVVRHASNQGLGGVYRTGFSQSRYEFVTLFPADGQFPASIIGEFAALMPNADLVIGYLPTRDDPVVAKALSLARAAIYRALFGKLPRMQGIIMVRAALLRRFTFSSLGRGATVFYELIIRAVRDGARIINAPTAMRPRMAGTSKVNNVRNVATQLEEAIRLRSAIASTRRAGKPRIVRIEPR